MESSTEILRKLLDERGVKYYDMQNRGIWFGISEDGKDHKYEAFEQTDGLIEIDAFDLTPEQAIAATLGRAKAKSHPYGYEPDTGAFDATRCECGCINDISATYCNDCGGEIEIDMDAEKEIYHTPAHRVFVEKHDDGSLEFAGKRYIAATLGCEQPPVDKLIRCLENDYGITASWDGLRKVWLTERATLGRGTCRMEQIPECQYDDIACSECGVALWAFSMDKEGEGVLATPNYCPYCGAKVVES